LSTVRRCCAENWIHFVERKLIRKDGEVIWVNRTVSLVRDAPAAGLFHTRFRGRQQRALPRMASNACLRC